VSPAEYELASKLAVEASGLAPDARTEFLNTACPPDIRSFVEQLISAHDNPDETVLKQTSSASLRPTRRLLPNNSRRAPDWVLMKSAKA
jgi:hypothetical protein